MLSDHTLGTESTSTFWSTWSKIKDFIPSLQHLPKNIASLQSDTDRIRKTARDKGIVQEALGHNIRLQQMYALSIDIKQKIDKYLPNWLMASKSSSSAYAGFGIAPIILIPLGATAIAALTYITTKGLILLKDFEYERSLVEDLKRRALTLPEVQALRPPIKPSTSIIEKIVGSTASQFAIPLSIIGIAAVWAYSKSKNW